MSPPNGPQSASAIRAPEHTNTTPFATDEQLAERIRRVEARLRDHDPMSAQELGEVATILDPNGAAS